MDKEQKNEVMMERFMQENGLVFGIPDEFCDETPEDGMVIHDWDGGVLDGTE